MSDDVGDGTRILTDEECLELLDRSGVGVLALSGVAAPILRPVNFARDGDHVVVRTGEGRILAAAQGQEPASFVLSAVDGFEHTGQSVVVTGSLSERLPSDSARSLPLRPWARSPKHHVVVLTMDEVSGREIEPMWGAS